ncbi:MAG: hypothetical protein K2J60_03635 [Acetatifactor sp.]|nr:hypothetical protein [Acetatifactor sp.]
MDKKDYENTSEDLRPNYRDQIIEMVVEIKKPEFLEFLYQLLQSFKKKWGI